MKNLKLTIELKTKTLREQFPKDECFNHVSLKLIGRLSDEDLRFLNGYSEHYEVDEDTGEELYHHEKFRWNTLDLDLSEATFDLCEFDQKELLNNNTLRFFVLPKDQENVKWKVGWFNNNTCNITSLEVSEGTKVIKEDSFCECRFLKKVMLPSTLEKIAPEAFVGCSSLQSFDFPNGSEYFVARDNVLFSPDRSILIAFPPGLRIEKYEIPQGTTLVAESAFKQNPYLKEVVIPASVVQIQDYAFENCASLEKIEVDSANPVYYSRHGALLEKNVWIFAPYQDMYIEERRDKMICVPAANTKPNLKIQNIALAARCFSGCNNAKSISYNSGFYPHRIDGAFDRCRNIEEINLTNVEVLPRFIDCWKLKKLNINGNFAGNFEYSLCRNDELAEINIEDNSEYITIEGVVYNKNHELIFYPPAKDDIK